ncbi:MAG: beta-galactosidase [Spirochaetota bacterium]
MKRVTTYRASNGNGRALLHGGDYNPDQWLDSPGVLQEDIRLMKMCKVNVVSLGIFAWVALEPEEGTFTFDWLDQTIDRLHAAGIGVFLATPTGARPAWMSSKYPEVLRVGPNRVRNLHGERHNHCYTSPVYREKSRIIDQHLATRYGTHPAVALWHLSNEYGGECHCPLCQDAFRSWLRQRYDDNLDALNKAWWTAFWSHTYTEWAQIESPAPHGECSVHGLVLDWRRFVSHQTREFMRHEIASIREITDEIPFTTNLMGFYPGLDYFKIAEDLDVVSWDSYPRWHTTDVPDGVDPVSWAATSPQMRDARLAATTAATHDLMRGCKRGKPFLLMESTPSTTNWMPVARRKRPGMHLASSMLAVAHGSDSVEYFQWRKSRGSAEKLHGAVVDHVGTEHTRVFRDVTDVGEALGGLSEIAGTAYPADVGIIFDWENRWAIEESKGPRNDGRIGYHTTVDKHASAFFRRGVNVDLIDSEQDFSGYKLLVAPMLYMIKPGVAERISEFVRNGGVLVTTYWSGIANESDLCFLGGFPGPLSDVLGVWCEEIDALFPDERVAVELEKPFAGQRTRYEAYELCDLIHLRGARALARYATDYYSGRPALTVNDYGAGRAYYIASRNEETFLHDFYDTLISQVDPTRAYAEAPAEGVHAALRTAENDDGSVSEYRFLINFADAPRRPPALLTAEEIIYRSPVANTGADEEPPRGADARTPSENGSIPALGVEIRRLTR